MTLGQPRQLGFELQKNLFICLLKFSKKLFFTVEISQKKSGPQGKQQFLLQYI